MAAKSLGSFIEDFKREHDGSMPGAVEVWYAAIEFAEEKFNSAAQSGPANTGSPKLPPIEDCIDGILGPAPVSMVEPVIWRKGAEDMYWYLRRQLRAGA